MNFIRMIFIVIWNDSEPTSQSILNRYCEGGIIIAKVILICGKICSGKTTYAQKLINESPAVLLSSDQAVLKLFGMFLGDEHEIITEKVEQYLLELSLDVLNAGVDVILDWGFWTANDRAAMNRFFADNAIIPQWHYIDCSRTQWEQNLRHRNDEVSRNKTTAFFVDYNLAEKCLEAFEVPEQHEMDTWYCWG